MDEIARAMAAWQDHDVELDVEAMEIVLRLAQVGAKVEARVGEVHRSVGLLPGDFDVLSSLFRNGSCSPTELARMLLLSKAGTSGRLSRLRQRGLVQEEPDTRDGRGKSVSLTARGFEVVHRTVRDHAAAEGEVFAPLSARDREALLSLLRRLGTS